MATDSQILMCSFYDGPPMASGMRKDSEVRMAIELLLKTNNRVSLGYNDGMNTLIYWLEEVE